MLMHQLVLDGAERHPGRLALRWVDRDRALTYESAVDAMGRMAGALAELGVAKGDRVTVFAHASVWHLVCMDRPQDGAHSLPELLAAGLPPPPVPRDETAVAHLSYTSGTTGKPNGACLRHEPTVRASRCIAERLRVRAHDVSFGPTALSSSYQFVGNLLSPLSQSASVHVMGRWTPASGFDALDAAGATMLVGNPPLLEELLTESRTRGRKPGSLRFVLARGGPVPPTLRAAWRNELEVPLVESCGQSELGGFVVLGYPELEHDDAKLARIGPPLPDKEVRIFGPADEPLPPGEVGEIVLRGGFMAGYWNRPEQTAAATRGGWLRTGDLGFLDGDGQLTLRSRRAESIEVAGSPWYPRDVEEALARQAGVRQAALIGLPDPELGAQPAAFVTIAEGASVVPEDLNRPIARELAFDLTPLAIRLVAELPMTPTGKIAKSELLAREASR